MRVRCDHKPQTVVISAIILIAMIAGCGEQSHQTSDDTPRMVPNVDGTLVEANEGGSGGLLGSSDPVDVETFVSLSDIVAEVQAEQIGESRFNTDNGEAPQGTPITQQDDVRSMQYWPVQLSVIRYFKTTDPSIEAFVVPDIATLGETDTDRSAVGAEGARGIAFIGLVDPSKLSIYENAVYRYITSRASDLSTPSQTYSIGILTQWIAFAGNEAVNERSGEVFDKGLVIQRIQTAVP